MVESNLVLAQKFDAIPKLHPCIPIHRYRIMVGINKTIYERRKPLSKLQLWFIRTKLNWEIDEI